MHHTERLRQKNFSVTIYLYNLLDVIKIAVVNRSLFTSIAAQLLALLSLPNDSINQLATCLVILASIFIFRAKHIWSLHAALRDNQIKINVLQHTSTKINISNPTLIHHIAISRKSILSQKLIIFITNLIMFYIANYQIAIALLVFLPTSIFPIIISKLCIFTIAFVCAFHLSSSKIKLIDLQLQQAQQLHRLLSAKDSYQVSSHHNHLRSILISCMYIASTIGIFILFYQMEFTNHSGIALAIITAITSLHYLRNSIHYMPTSMALINFFTTIMAAPYIVHMHKQFFQYLANPLVNKSTLTHIYTSIHSTLSALYGYCLYKQEIQHSTTVQLLNHVKLTPPIKAKVAKSKKGSVDVGNKIDRSKNCK